MLKRLCVKGYKSLRDVDVSFGPLTVVFGPNAVGKSNLLDAIALLSAMVTRPDLNAAFADHRGHPLEAFTFPDGGIKHLQHQSTATFGVEADVELSEGVVNSLEGVLRQAREGLPGSTGPRRSVIERRLRYSISVEIRTESGHLRVIDEKLEALNADWTPKASRKPFLETVRGKHRIHLRMEKQAHPTYEDLGQDRTVVSKSLYPPHYPHITAFKMELSRWRFYFLEPGSMRSDTPLKEVGSLSRNGSDLAAFYNTLRATNPLQLRALSKTLTQVIPSITNVDVDRTDQGLLTLQVYEEGMPLPSRLASEGTLRVLGLLAITNPLEPLTLVGYEEPENGVHPARLSMVARLLSTAAARGATQFIINTHSPVLPELFADDDGATLLACRKRGRHTMFEVFEQTGFLARKEIERVLEEDVSRLRDRLVRGDFG